MDYTAAYNEYRERIDTELAKVCDGREPDTLYDPVRYVLESGGKRIRGVLTLLGCEAVGGTVDDALPAAMAVETLHNFSLVHDDIMDRADSRRGRPTVHVKWDQETALLTGDVMIGLAQQLLVMSPTPRGAQATGAFACGLVDICEGQTYDRDFERRDDVTLEEYFKMIRLKTARLIEMAVEVGAFIGAGDRGQIATLTDYAREVGLGFQIQDDLLDIVAEEAQLGKMIGGDVVVGKRTWPLLVARSRVQEAADIDLLQRLLDGPGLPESEIDSVRDLYDRLGVLKDGRLEVERRCRAAIEALETIPASQARDLLRSLAEALTVREH